MNKAINSVFLFAAILLIAACSSDDNEDVSSLSDANNAANQITDDGAQGGDVGITLSAEDEDDDDTVTYSLTDDGDGFFQVDANSGAVTLKVTLAELAASGADSFSIEALATSSDGSTSDASFTISYVVENPVGTLSDANDAANMVSENANFIGTPIITS